MRRVDVLLVDRSEDFMDAVADWLTADPMFRVVGKAQRGLEVVELVESRTPDLVLVDATLPDLNGFQVARGIKSLPDPPVVLLTAFHDSETARREARLAGADDLLAKSDFTRGLEKVVRDFSTQGALRTNSRAGADRAPDVDLAKAKLATSLDAESGSVGGAGNPPKEESQS